MIMEFRHSSFSNVLCIYLLFIVGFDFMNIYAVQATFVSNCDQFTYSVQHPYQNVCMQCKICPFQVQSKLHSDACKKKIPNPIPGQGYAWCTGDNNRPPWCKHLSVTNGNLSCSHGNDVYSRCKLLCNPGYVPKNSNWTNLKCLDSLQWNISDQSSLTCVRTVKPDKPLVISHGQRKEVKSGSEKTLVCVPSSEVVGKHKTYWYFKDKQLYSDSDSDIYVVHGVSSNNEGEYFCQVEDQTGRSDLSTGYFLKVEPGSSEKSELAYFIIIGITCAVCVILGTLLILYVYNNFTCVACHRKCVALWHMITKCQYHHEDELGDNCLRSLGSDDVDRGNFQDHGKTKNMTYNNVEVNSDTDQNDLRSVLRNCGLMKKLKIFLDQKPDRNEAKPTFHSLGHYLRNDPDEIANHEFNCQQNGTSPTEGYIRKMAEQGQGLSNLLNFLKNYKHTHMVAEVIEEEVKSNKYYAAII